MVTNVLAVQAALRTICQAPTHALVSCSLELHEANFAIAEALLSLSKSHKYQGHLVDHEDQERVTTSEDKPPSDRGGNNDQNRLQKCETWLSRPETAVVNLAQYWLQTRAFGSEYKSGQNEIPLIIRKAVVSNSPAVLAVLKRVFIKRRRLGNSK
jgi:hypothetical protein